MPRIPLARGGRSSTRMAWPIKNGQNPAAEAGHFPLLAMAVQRARVEPDGSPSSSTMVSKADSRALGFRVEHDQPVEHASFDRFADHVGLLVPGSCPRRIAARPPEARGQSRQGEEAGSGKFGWIPVISCRPPGMT